MSEEKLETIGDRIKATRLHQQKTLGELSKLTGIRQTTLHDIEVGRISHPKALPKIAEALGVPDTYLEDPEAFGLAWLVISQAKGKNPSFAEMRRHGVSGEGDD